VGAIVFDPTCERVLLIERGAPPAQGQWSFPGGLVEAGESLRDACARELHEETGVRADLVDLAVVVERMVPDEQGATEYHFVIIDFWGRLTEEQTPIARSDARQAAWVPIAEVADLPTTRGVPAAVTRASALARGESSSSPLLGA
jgi:ADP-ribose pyrophosphatase YjhB (NUDIX family)